MILPTEGSVIKWFQKAPTANAAPNLPIAEPIFGNAEPITGIPLAELIIVLVAKFLTPLTIL